ncbi:nuclease-related domain-containing protein [Candidatus Nitrosotenuis uzonensis]|uniref:NERD domain-containing protein n=1 Tax=Candidatus Nitrosotenuis uzonensis TaxID=1407055 RepID=V6ASJ6_9ARCH|nr:nuclease-related domain-containing protein [Candidatus Nitrosotenuis uzonensis]CDI05510.1 hypothetical protein NITUZ_30202 [Candidatus Nitrosotenuis uzonensis]
MAVIYGSSGSERHLLSKYPKEVRAMNYIPYVQQMYQEQLQKDAGLFAFLRRWDKSRRLKKFEENKNNPLYAGANGERVLQKLSELPDDWHILCNLRITLPFAARYSGYRNLRSAQMDFVTVSKKGVFLIEIKNWSERFTKNYEGFSPYEQTDRAGRVLWITLKPFLNDMRVTNVLLSIGNTISYNQKYMSVLVTSLEKINHFLENRQYRMTENDVWIAVHTLKQYVE